MDGNKGWTLHCKTGPIKKGEYYADLRIRTDASGDDSLTTRVGFYDEAAKTILYAKTLKVSEISGKEFKTIRLGPMELTPNAYFYIGGFNRKNVDPGKVYVDQFILRKNDAGIGGAAVKRSFRRHQILILLSTPAFRISWNGMPHP